MRAEIAMGKTINGPVWAARNWSIDAGAGSIHDDSTASELGFRGGTVAGDVHMNQFPPVLLRIFGDAWFERGNLSLNFKNATVDLERVQVFAEEPEDGEQQVRVWMEREDGMLVCTGTAALGDHSKSELRSKNLRPCDPSELRILHKLHSGLSLGSYDVLATPDKQFRRYDTNVISDPLDDVRKKYDVTSVKNITHGAAPCPGLRAARFNAARYGIHTGRDEINSFSGLLPRERSVR